MKIFFGMLLSFSSLAIPVIDWKGSRQKTIRNYLKVQKQFSNKICKESYRTYDKLHRDFRGTGYFVPVINEENLDRETIEKNLYLIESKYQWITQQRDRLAKLNSTKGFSRKHKNLKKIFNDLVEVKHKYFLSSEKKDELILKGEKLVKLLHDRHNQLLDQASFIKPYGYPVNHFEMRKDYDFFKEVSDESGQKKKNGIYFRRQVFEDGAQNTNHTRSDRFFRAILNSMDYAFDEQTGIITEDFRYDYEYVLKSMKYYLKQSKRFHLRRLDEWRTRTKEHIDFYSKLLKEENNQYTNRILREKSKAKFELKNFTLKKLSETYQFWMKQSELHRALFSIETILFNEVGDIDGRDALERKDVTQVVINRTNIPFYRSIEEDDAIYPYLEHLGNNTISKKLWLNVMFKEGEFSFTYFFIGGSKNIYCPDMSRRGRFIRNENLKIALNLLKKPNPEFNAIRYFSRSSMLGRINMANIWSDFRPLPMRLGKRLKKSKIYYKLYNRGKYDFLHPFEGGSGNTYYVLRIKKKPYVLDTQQKTFYTYRNPHYFTYFAPK